MVCNMMARSRSMLATLPAIAFAPTVAAAAKAIALIVFVIDFMSVSPFRNIGSRG